MKYIVIVACLLSLLSLGLIAAETAAKRCKLTHTVFFKFKETATKEQITKVENDFRALKWGTNVSPEHHDKGFTHCFVLTFATEADRNTYLTHPAHKEFGKVLGPILGEVMVLDFWGK